MKSIKTPESLKVMLRETGRVLLSTRINPSWHVAKSEVAMTTPLTPAKWLSCEANDKKNHKTTTCVSSERQRGDWKEDYNNLQLHRFPRSSWLMLRRPAGRDGGLDKNRRSEPEETSLTELTGQNHPAVGLTSSCRWIKYKVAHVGPICP